MHINRVCVSSVLTGLVLLASATIVPAIARTNSSLPSPAQNQSSGTSLEGDETGSADEAETRALYCTYWHPCVYLFEHVDYQGTVWRYRDTGYQGLNGGRYQTSSVINRTRKYVELFMDVNLNGAIDETVCLSPGEAWSNVGRSYNDKSIAIQILSSGACSK